MGPAVGAASPSIAPSGAFAEGNSHVAVNAPPLTAIEALSRAGTAHGLIVRNVQPQLQRLTLFLRLIGKTYNVIAGCDEPAVYVQVGIAL